MKLVTKVITINISLSTKQVVNVILSAIKAKQITIKNIKKKRKKKRFRQKQVRCGHRDAGNEISPSSKAHPVTMPAIDSTTIPIVFSHYPD